MCGSERQKVKEGVPVAHSGKLHHLQSPLNNELIKSNAIKWTEHGRTEKCEQSFGRKTCKEETTRIN